MRAAIRLLTLFCLIWCGLHVAEPAAAQGIEQVTVLSTGAPADPCDTGSDQTAHAGHHHCPLAWDQPVARDTLSPAARTAPRAAAIASLSSLSRAPPLQPPAA